MLASENQNYILCTLSKKRDVLQVPLDLVFSEGDEIAFSCAGGVVHLTGYLVPNDDDFDGFGGEEGDSDLELGDEEQEQVALTKKPNKKLQQLLEAAGQDDDSDDDVDSDVDEENGQEDDDEDDDDDEEDDEDDDDDSEEEEDEEIFEPVAKKQKQQNGVAVNGKAPKQPEAVAKTAVPTTTKPKTITGGVIVEDIRVGKGEEAKAGRTVQVSFFILPDFQNNLFFLTYIFDMLKYKYA